MIDITLFTYDAIHLVLVSIWKRFCYHERSKEGYKCVAELMLRNCFYCKTILTGEGTKEILCLWALEMALTCVRSLVHIYKIKNKNIQAMQHRDNNFRVMMYAMGRQ